MNNGPYLTDEILALLRETDVEKAIREEREAAAAEVQRLGPQTADNGVGLTDFEAVAVAPEFVSTDLENASVETNLSEPEGNIKFPFAPISLDLVMEDDEPEWTWNGYVAPEAVTLIAGVPKVGKTSLLFALLSALSKGEPFLGRATRRSRILLLTEERRRTLAPKVQKHGLSDEVHRLRHDQVAPTGANWAEVVQASVAYCRENELDVLVVDTWPRWARIAEENAAGEVLATMTPIHEAAATGLAVVLAAHQRKARGSYGEGVRGSNALTGEVDVVVEIERATVIKDKTARVLLAVSRFDETPENLVIALEDEGYVVRGDTETAKKEADRQAVLDAVLGAQQADVAEVAEATDLTKSTVRDHLNALHAAGRIGRTGAGKRGDPHVFVSTEAVPKSVETNLRLLDDPKEDA